MTKFRSDRLSATTISVITLSLFILLAILVTYPIATRLSEFSVLHLYTDDLLESWTIEWDVHSFLSGPAGSWQIWEANIFYPYPLTLAFTEHLLPTSLLLMPFSLLGSTPLVATNLGVLFTTVLSGWGTYLLVTWLTGNRWAGLVAGLFFASAPFRLSHITQLHLISTHWIPFIFLAAARLIKLNRTTDLLLLIIFTNLQFLSVINYAPLVAIALAIWIIFFLIICRKRVSSSLFIRLLVFGLITFAFNWPVLRLYQQVSERMELVRTLGDAGIYGASILNYILPIGNSLLYGRLLNLPTHIDYLSQSGGTVASTFPGVVVLLLALVGTGLLLKPKANRHLAAIVLALLIIAAIGFVLSFGSNEMAFGESLSALTARLLPYAYLYEILPLLQGLRVPLRFALLTTFALALLAGIGFAAVGWRLKTKGNNYEWAIALLVGILILAEHLPAPLPGVSVPYGGHVYSWLAKRPGSVVLELPYYLHTDHSYMELLRVYQSPEHWQRLVNGNSGFEPTWLVELGQVLDGFPDWRSFDVMRQLGLNYVVLHRDQYEPQDWDNLVALLPGYLPSIEAVYTVGNDLVLELKPPACKPNPALVFTDAGAFPSLSISNWSSATFVADPHRISAIVAGSQDRQFLEPLFVFPGQTLTVDLPIGAQAEFSDWQVNLANLNRTLTAFNPSSQPPANQPLSSADWQPVQIPFANGAVLQAMAIGGSLETCGVLALNLEWFFPDYADEMIQVELIDRFDRLVMSNASQPMAESEAVFSTHILPLAETVPPGLYQLQVQLLTVDGADIKPLGPDGAPVNIPVSLPIVIRPGLTDGVNVGSQAEISHFANGVKLLGVEGLTLNATAGDWMRFVLTWQSDGALSSDYTVFTQFLGPDGQMWGQHDNPPKGGWYPTSLWKAEEVVTDDYAVQVDPAAPSGEYHLIVGLYNPATGERVRVATGKGAGNDFVDMATIMVTNP